MENKIQIPNFKIQKYEVIGQGGMIYTPCQVGEWWVIPAQEYQGKIPTEVQQNLFDLLNRGTEIQGLLVAEDMRVIEAKRKQEARLRKQQLAREARQRETQQELWDTGVEVARNVLTNLAVGLAFLIRAVVMFDPMLIAVLPDGRWICLGTWYD